MRADLDKTLRIQMLFVQHMQRVRGFVLTLLPDFSLVDDVMQEIFLTVTAKADDFQEGTNFLAWVLTIARFRVLKAMNAMGREFVPLAPEVIEKLAQEEAVVETEIDRRLHLLNVCLNKLAPQARRLISLRYYQGLKPGVIAQRLGLGVNGISVTLARARLQLRLCIERGMAQEHL